MRRRFGKKGLIVVRRIMLMVVLLALADIGFLQDRALAAGKETIISDFEEPLDIKTWALKMPGLDGKLSEEEVRIDYETKIVAQGKEGP